MTLDHLTQSSIMDARAFQSWQAVHQMTPHSPNTGTNQLAYSRQVSCPQAATSQMSRSRGEMDRVSRERNSTYPVLQQHASLIAPSSLSMYDQSTQMAASGRWPVCPSPAVRVRDDLNPQTNVFEMPGKFGLKLAKELDIGQQWTRLVRAADNTAFMLDGSVIPELQRARSTGSSTRDLLMRYSSLNMTVQTLVELLAKADLQSAMLILRQPEPLQILRQPKEYVDLSEGDSLSLTCEAVGFPRPQFKWFQHREGKTQELVHQTTDTLRVSNVSMDQSGCYCCRVYNGTQYETPQSSWAYVEVKPSRKPVDSQIAPTVEASRHTVKVGQLLRLRCEITGHQASTYQWCRDGVPVLGCDKPVLELRVLDDSFSGKYVCEVSSGPNSHAASHRSIPVVVQVVAGEAHILPTITDTLSYTQPLQTTCYTAQAKVAFLVGTENYMTGSGESLPAARNDVLTLEGLLTKMDFMVFSLLDMSKAELIQHVHWFCNLIDEGVYVLFFYIGHGFKHNQQSFLIPWDAPVGYGTSDCVHLEKDVLIPILDKKPALCFAIIDICRTGLSQISAEDCPEDVDLPARGTTCIFYTTSPGNLSYEHRDTKQGIFMTHLCKVIHRKVSIQELHNLVLSEIKRDPAAGELQYPEMKSNLNSTLSLHDPIDYRDNADKMNIRFMQWELTQRVPRRQTVHIASLGFAILIGFSRMLSNALVMRTTVVRMGSVSTYSLRVDEVPPEITGSQEATQTYDKPDKIFVTKFLDLQRLKGTLRPTLVVEMEVEGKKQFHYQKLDLGKPLVASLHLPATVEEHATN